MHTPDHLLGREKIPVLIRKLALPGIVAQLINILYNIVDRMYVGHMREHAAISLTGLGVAAPIIILIAAFCNMVGSGAAPLAAIELGRKDIHKAETLLGNSFAFLMTLAALLTAGALIFMKPLLYLFGATENSHPFARDYMTLYALGTVFVLLSLGLNTFIACQGHARAAMFTTVIGAVANIILDPVFIYLFDMGVKGAAIATVISQALSAAFVLRFLTSGRSAIRLKRHLIRLHPRILRAIVALGVSGFVINATESAIIMVFNQGLIRYGGELGDLYVGTMTILQSAMMLVFMPLSGFTMGVQPIFSFNLGAGRTDRVAQAVKTTAVIAFAYTLVFCTTIYLFPGLFAGLFTPDPGLVASVKGTLPLFMAGMWGFGLQMTAQSFFVGTNQVKKSLFVALLRKVILLIPLALFLPRVMGVRGIFIAEPISDMISVSVCTLLLVRSLREMRKRQQDDSTA